MIQKSALQRACVVMLGACLLITLSGAAFAAGTDDAVPQNTTAKKKKASNSTSKVKFMRGSEESPAERRARLRIECKGAANAGVCTGYTR